MNNLLTETAIIYEKQRTTSTSGITQVQLVSKGSFHTRTRQLNQRESVQNGKPIGEAARRYYFYPDTPLKKDYVIEWNGLKWEVTCIDNVAGLGGDIQLIQCDTVLISEFEAEIVPPIEFNFLGNWDADLNEPELVNDSELYNNGDAYYVVVAGNQWDTDFNVGDWVVFDGDNWVKVINPAIGVASVNGKTGVVTLDASDVGAYPDTNPDNYISEVNWSELVGDQSDIDLTNFSVNKDLDMGGNSIVGIGNNSLKFESEAKISSNSEKEIIFSNDTLDVRNFPSLDGVGNQLYQQYDVIDDRPAYKGVEDDTCTIRFFAGEALPVWRISKGDNLIAASLHDTQTPYEAPWGTGTVKLAQVRIYGSEITARSVEVEQGDVYDLIKNKADINEVTELTEYIDNNFLPLTGGDLTGNLFIPELFTDNVFNSNLEGSFKPTSLRDGLVSSWTMDNVDGTQVFDEVGENNGTTFGNCTFEEGKNGDSTRIIANGGINFPSDSNLVNDEMSVSFWIKINSNFSAFSGILGKADADWTQGWGFYTPQNNNNKLRFFAGGSGPNGTPLVDLPFGEWCFVTAVVRGIGQPIDIYINNQKTTSTQNAGASLLTGGSTHPFTIGHINFPTGFNINNANIDEVNVWNRALSDEEVNKLYKDSDGFFYPFFAPDTNNIVISNIEGKIKNSSVSIDEGPLGGGSIINLITFDEDPLGLVEGDTWIKNEGNGKLLKFFDGEDKYSIELTKE